MWAVSRHDDVVAVLEDTRRFSSVGLGRSFLPPWLERNPVAASLVMKNPPEHTRLRGLVSRAFSGAALQRLEARVRAIAEEFAEAVVRRREVDFVAAFSLRLPVRVLNLFFGLEPELWPRMRVWADDLLSVPACHPTPERGEGLEAAGGVLVPVVHRARPPEPAGALRPPRRNVKRENGGDRRAVARCTVWIQNCWIMPPSLEFPETEKDELREFRHCLFAPDPLLTVEGGIEPMAEQRRDARPCWHVVCAALTARAALKPQHDSAPPCFPPGMYRPDTENP
ncbi:putative cytochrome P450 [Cystobacter fuscus DSM 2262]|uniref:Cytochrome P450 n=1 Tax=Cystobacter fuscus (strain ATCC 25194 / DSM 2262 / NBRC 100088 / M29) TaxID=1242864 RepID=S9QQ39_CYSF2|nr:putative cytochrome P450 [Cystobacter fuscus DSM 2262]